MKVSVCRHCVIRGILDPRGRRYVFYGRGKDLQKAVILSFHYTSVERFVTVSARESLSNPFKYATEGCWVDRPEVDS